MDDEVAREGALGDADRGTSGAREGEGCGDVVEGDVGGGGVDWAEKGAVEFDFTTGHGGRRVDAGDVGADGLWSCAAEGEEGLHLLSRVALEVSGRWRGGGRRARRG